MFGYVARGAAKSLWKTFRGPLSDAAYATGAYLSSNNMSINSREGNGLRKRKHGFFGGNISGPATKKQMVRRVKQIVRNGRARRVLKKYKARGYGYRKKYKGRRGRKWGGQKNESGEIFTITYKKSKNYRQYKALTMPCTEIATKGISTLYSDIGVGNAGRQLVVLVDTYNKGTDYLAFSSQPQLNYTATVGGAGALLHPYTFDATQTSTNFLQQYVQVKLIVSNAAPSDCVGDFYWVIAKTTETTAFSPVADWASAINTQKGDSGGYQNYTPGTKPTDLKAWNIKYKVVKKSKIALASGAEETITFRFNTNRIVDLSYANTYNTIRGLTMGCFFVGHGQLCDSTNDKTVGNITYSPVKLVALQEVRNCYRQMIQTSRKTIVTTNLSTTQAGFVTDENSGVVDNAFLAANFA